MSTPKIFESEYRFCLILWEHEPLPSAELAKLCKERLGWSRTTTYTVIHRLGERGVVKNKNGLVSSLVSKDEAQAAAPGPVSTRPAAGAGCSAGGSTRAPCRWPSPAGTTLRSGPCAAGAAPGTGT